MDRLLDTTRETFADLEEKFEETLAEAGGKMTLAMSAVFNDAAMPAGFMEKFRDMIIWLNQLAGDMSRGSGFGGSLGQKSTDERREEESERAKEGWERVSDQMERSRTEECEREEWARSMHSYAGMEMSGAEWGEFANELKADTPLRRWLVDYFKKKGSTTDAEAQQQADQVSLLAKMQSLPPSQWTPEMKALHADLQAHPEKKSHLDDALRAASLARSSPEISQGKALKDDQSSNNATVASVGTSADVLAASGNGSTTPGAALSLTGTLPLTNALFASAPDLSAHYEDAVAATEPLDKPKESPPRIATAAPAPTAMPASSGGFDV